MKFTRARAITAALLLLSAGAAGALYMKYRSFSAFIAQQVSGQAARKLGRQVKLGQVRVSPLGNVVITDACISRRPDFAKGNFFCAGRAVIRPQLRALLRNQVYFSGITLEKPVLKVRERNGRWDFEDLLALLPDTQEGLYMTWNASELELEGASIEADLETSGLSFSLENADLKLEHYSPRGGNFSLEAEGRLRTVHRGKLVSALVELEAEANYEREGLASTRGSFKAADISYGAASLLRLTSDWALFNMLRPLPEKNYSVSLSASGLMLPAQENRARDSVTKALNLLSAAMGKSVPKIEDIEAGAVSGSFRLDDSVLSLQDLVLRANFMDLDAALAINGPGRSAEAELSARIGDNRIKMSASGPMDKPAIKPLLSDTLTAKFREALRGVEDSLLTSFPVTGEKR